MSSDLANAAVRMAHTFITTGSRADEVASIVKLFLDSDRSSATAWRC